MIVFAIREYMPTEEGGYRRSILAAEWATLEAAEEDALVWNDWNPACYYVIEATEV